MVLKKTSFILGVLLGVLLVGCTSFGYKYYGISEVDWETGKILGPKPADDLPFSACKPLEIADPATGQIKLKHQCVIMFSSEFFEMKKEHESLKIKLINCQKNCRR